MKLNEKYNKINFIISNITINIKVQLYSLYKLKLFNFKLKNMISFILL